MGVFDRMTRGGTLANVSWEPLDERWYSEPGAWANTFAGFGVSPDTAKRVSAVFACNSVIAETLASMPCTLYVRERNGGRRKAEEHRLYRTLRRVVNDQLRLSPMEYFSGNQMNLGMRGRALARIEDDGRRVRLWPLTNDKVQVDQLPSGRLRYKNLADDRQPTYLQEDILDVRDMSTDGFNVEARTALAREAIAVSAAAEAFVGAFFKNDATGRLVIKHPGNLSPEKRKEFRQMVQENYAGARKASKVMLLTHGVDATELGKQDGGKFIVDPRNFQAQDVARFWRVPSFLIGLPGPTAWGGGLEEQIQGFVDFTMKPWADRWAQAMMLALLDENELDEYFIEFNFNDLARGKLLDRYQAYQIAKNIGVASPNEIRIKENESPRPGGDEYQEAPAGAAAGAFGAPGAPAPRRGPPPTEDGGATPDDAQARRALPAPASAAALPAIPVALLEDAARRIAAAEARGAERRPKRDPERLRGWAEDFFKDHETYIVRVLAPLGDGFGLPAWVMDTAAERLCITGRRAIAADALPPDWPQRRGAEIVESLGVTFALAGRIDGDAIVRHQASTALTHASDITRAALQALEAFAARPPELTATVALPPRGKRQVVIQDSEGHVLRTGTITEVSPEE